MNQSTLSTLVVTTSGPFIVTDMRGPRSGGVGNGGFDHVYGKSRMVRISLLIVHQQHFVKESLVFPAHCSC